MVFYILTSIVFIAELIIAAAILIYLFKADKLLREYNSLIKELNPKISDLMKTITKISEQIAELSPVIAENIRSFFVNLLIGQLKSILGGLTFWLVKREVEKHITE